MRLATNEPRRLAARLIEVPLVQSIELRGDALTVQTRKPAEFFALVNQLVVDERIELSELDTIDAGAEAVFDYLQEGTR